MVFLIRSGRGGGDDKRPFKMTKKTRVYPGFCYRERKRQQAPLQGTGGGTGKRNGAGVQKVLGGSGAGAKFAESTTLRSGDVQGGAVCVVVEKKALG